MTVFDPHQATLQRAMSALQSGNGQAAEQLLKTVLRAQSKHITALNLLGIVLTQLGKFAEAESYLRRALRENPRSDATLYNYGIVLKALDRPAEALDQFTAALAINSTVADTWNNRGTVLNALGRHEEAIADFDNAIRLNPRLADPCCNKGKALNMLSRRHEALQAFDAALALRPDLAEAWCGRGEVCWTLERYDEALAACDRALALRPGLAEAWLGRGNVLAKLGRQDDAFAAYDKALALRPDFAWPWLGRGNICVDLKRYEEALSAYDKALALKPDLAEAWSGRASVYFARSQHSDALAAYERALTLKPDFADAWLARGNVLFDLRRCPAALAAYDRAVALKPDLDYAAGCRLAVKLQISDWSNLDAEAAACLAAIRRGKLASTPFDLLPLPSSPADQLQCAKRYVADRTAISPPGRSEIHSHDRIRVAYVSADFGEHPVAYLMAGLYEQHDRSRFEITGISFGSDRTSPTRQRLERALDRFIDVGDKDERAIAELMRALEIDIAVDLMGHTRHGRPGIFARRPAPIQVSYLGFLGTIGADFIDYVIADAIALPFDRQQYFMEKIVHLPHCFLVNDDKLAIAPQTPARTDVGLPADGFVFCSFNNSYKLWPAMFELWMRLLQGVEGSVLWLVKANAEMADNLRREALRCGVDPGRLVFASHVPLAEHMARQRLADLFLDTAPYNAGATAAAALWSGVPLLTLRGETFVGRMAASMLEAVGLPELVTDSPADYESLAMRIAADPEFCAALRQKLARNRETYPLFDTARLTRHLEDAYVTMWQTWQAGRPPAAFAVPAR